MAARSACLFARPARSGCCCTFIRQFRARSAFFTCGYKIFLRHALKKITLNQPDLQLLFQGQFMKWKLSLVFILFVHLCPAQKAADPDAIDSRVSQLDAPTPDSLAMLLTACYPSEMEKTRAIFSWIAQHIEYN